MTFFCISQLLSQIETCSYCVGTTTHIHSKFGTEGPRYWESLSAFWRTWKNKNKLKYKSLWDCAIENKKNGHSVYKQIDDYKKEIHKLFATVLTKP